MVKSKTKSVSNQGALSNFSKAECSIYNFLKFVHEILMAAAICFVMERGRRKSQQNPRIHVRAQKNWFIQYETCLTHPNRGMIRKSKEFQDVGRVASSFPT